MKITTPFNSTGCNRHPSAADWRPSTSPTSSGLVAYAARSTIALWDPEDPRLRGVRRVLKGHAETVNAVRWVRIPVYGEDGKQVGEEMVLVSGSGGVASEVGVWVQRHGEEGEEDDYDYIIGHMEKVRGSINDIASVSGPGGRKGCIVATAGADGAVSIWSLYSTRPSPSSSQSAQPTINLAHSQSLTTKPKFLPLTLSLSTLPDSNSNSSALILAAAGSTNSIQIYVSSHSQEPFSLRATLAGHENWVRSLAFTFEKPSGEEGGGGGGGSDLLLASASQDKYIRLWKVHHGGKSNITGGFGAVGAGRSALSNKVYRFTTTSANEAEKEYYSITFEALLVGHEDWIYTVKWRPTTPASPANVLQLLSASSDNSLSLWTPDPSTGIWLSTTRLGEISDQKGSSTAAGGAGGLWIGLFSPSGTHVAAIGRTGGWRLWGYDELQDRWTGKVAVTGHTRDVTGISWGGPRGDWLLSTSLDQTTRIWARWRKESGGGGGWHEMARPQIHGYDINCVSWLPRIGQKGKRKGGWQFVSGADEKLLRVFEEPRGVASLLARLTSAGSVGEGDVDDTNLASLPEGAEQPALGLSNKTLGAVGADPTSTGDSSPPLTNPLSLSTLPHPPLETHLSRHTLFPETSKLYGHGYELQAVASAHHTPIIATSSRASSTDHAVIRLFDTAQEREVKPPVKGGHALTVLGMEFSRDDGWLLSVSRDRSWAVYRRNPSAKEGDEGGAAYTLVARQPSKGGHTRVIWTGKWAPPGEEGGGGQEEGRVFATGSRDKSVKIWVRQHPQEDMYEWVCTRSIKFPTPVMAIDFLQERVRGKLVLAVGLESGEVEVYSGGEEGAWGKVGGVGEAGGAVREVRWRPTVDPEGGRMLAVAGEDGSVRVYEVGGL
ncbi:RNA polymerase II 90 kDa subunit [Tirmania nivea]|nr:RNA polymerase II 90 kDa subunit [Tirmania nivea]